jgi:predicted enzyme related to lactoylglutathione lyase
MDIENVGRFCIINDPTGGTLSLIQLEQPQPVPAVMAWNELMTRDAAAAGAFYAGLLGWETQSIPMGDGPEYTACRSGENMVAGILQMDGPQFEGVPTNWMNYIGTKNIEGDAAKIAGLGGTVVVPPTEIPNMGRFCTFSDPGGGHIAMYQSPEG